MTANDGVTITTTAAKPYLKNALHKTTSALQLKNYNKQDKNYKKT